MPPNNGHAFQSLLWWIAVVNLLECEARWTVCPCFNPCCGGLQSSTSRRSEPMNAEKRFQSLLWWIAVVNNGQVFANVTAANLFQSLLWWIAVVNC